VVGVFAFTRAKVRMPVHRRQWGLVAGGLLHC